jgi:hypothetical protein
MIILTYRCRMCSALWTQKSARSLQHLLDLGGWLHAVHGCGGSQQGLSDLLGSREVLGEENADQPA